MTERPWPRTRFTSWFAKSLPVSNSENEIVEATVIHGANSSTDKNADPHQSEFNFSFTLLDEDVDRLPEVGEPVSFWAPPDDPEAIIVYRRGSVGGAGKLGSIRGDFARRIARHRASGLPFDTEIREVSAGSCTIRCSLISAGAVEAARTKEREELLAELQKQYRPRTPIIFSIDAKSIVLETGQLLTFESIPSADKCAADLHGSRIILRADDGKTVEKNDEPTVKKKLVRLSHTFPSMKARVIGKGKDKHWYESEYMVQVETT
jgi:hypothetical protein